MNSNNSSSFTNTESTPAANYGLICRMENPMPHCAVMLVLDTSHSMWGAGLADMMSSLAAFYDTLRSEQFANAQIDIAAVSLGDRLGMLEEFTPFEASLLPRMQIRPKGDTPVGAALTLALDKIGDQLRMYRENGASHVTPQLIILSDGDSSDDFSAAAARIRQLSAAGQLVCRVIATGDNPNLTALHAIAGENVSIARQSGMSATFVNVGKVVSQSYEDEAETIIDETFASQAPVSAVGDGGTILIDGTNVMHWAKGRSGVTLKHLLAITRYFDECGIRWEVLFDASSRHLLSAEEQAVFEDLLKTRPEEFQQVPAKTRADDFLLMRADADPAARIISNDMYRDYAAEYPWVGERKRFIRGMVMRDEVFLLDGEGNRTRIPAEPGKSSDWSLNE